MDNVSLLKSELRRKYIAVRDALDKEYKRSAENSVISSIIALDEFKCADNLLLYYPVKSELNVLPLLSAARESGKTVAFPKCDKQTLTMSFFEARNENDLRLGAYGIKEPSDDCPKASYDEKTLCIVPAVAFSREGHRIGYGKGFYDKFLSDFSGKSIGITFEALLADTLPYDELDRKLDIIITEKGVYRFEI